MRSLRGYGPFARGGGDDVGSAPPVGRGARGTTPVVARQAATLQRTTRTGDDPARQQAPARARRAPAERRALRARRPGRQRRSVGLGPRARSLRLLAAMARDARPREYATAAALT